MDSSGMHLWLVLMKAIGPSGDTRAAASSLGAGFLRFCDPRAAAPQGPAAREHHRPPQSDLTSGAITSAVDRLEAQGLVVRTSDPEDRRTRFVSLTPKGTALIRKVFGVHKRAMEGATSSLTAAERKTLIDLIKKLGRAAEEQLAKGSKS